MFHSDVVWHVFNPNAPEPAGSYKGAVGIAEFFQRVRSFCEGRFSVRPPEARALGVKLVVAQARNCFGHGAAPREFDVVVAWRVLDGTVTDLSDIPAVQTT